MDGSSLSRAIGQSIMMLVIGALLVGLLLGVGGFWACGKLAGYRINIVKVEEKK